MVKRKINEIIVHCSASPASTKTSDIRDWHKKRGWSDIGYNFVIEHNGLIKNGRDKDIVGAHCEGHNSDTLGVCMIGGLQGDGSFVNFSQEQIIALKILLEGIFMSYGRLPVNGHHAYNKGKSCPNFDVVAWMADGMPPTPSKYTVKKWKD